MRKTDKKIDKQLRDVLTNVCETALKNFSGFQWLTHVVNYSNFPKSLKITCVFDTNDNLNGFMATNARHEFSTLIQAKLFEININMTTSHISFDTEEDCSKSNNGNWVGRLAK